MIQPKYSLQTEETVLESLMGWGDHNEPRVQKAMLKLDSDCFYNACNCTIFRMIKECFNRQEPFDFVTILTLIDRNDDAIHQTQQNLIQNYRTIHASDANFEVYCDRLVTLAQLRKQLSIAKHMIDDVMECGSPEKSNEILVSALTEISGLTFMESKHGITNIELTEAFYDGKLITDTVYPTTCKQLNDALNGGIVAKSFITVAAGAGVGKTGFAIFLMDAIARMQGDTQSLFFSLEMEAKQIWMRHMGVCAGKQFDKLSYDERLKAAGKLMQLPVTIYDAAMCKSAADIDFILTTARLKAMDKKISVIVVDYLGLVEAKGNYESNALKQTDITSKLARLAIELDCIVIALSQINRSPSSRATDDRCPYPSDASGSSGSYFSSTLWLGVDRPELYQDDPIYRNQFVIKCRKNRFGGVFDLILAFNNGTFAEVPEEWFKQPQITPIVRDKSIFRGARPDFLEN